MRSTLLMRNILPEVTPDKTSKFRLRIALISHGDKILTIVLRNLRTEVLEIFRKSENFECQIGGKKALKFWGGTGGVLTVVTDQAAPLFHLSLLNFSLMWA